MIPSEIMDKIIRVPDEEEETEAKIEELKEAGFVITNFSKGGVFYILLRIAIHIGVQLKQLAVDLINSAFMKHCPDDWVEIRAADYSKTLDEGEKTEDYLTITRKDTSQAARIARGHPFRTTPDAYGGYLRFYALEDTILPANQATQKVLVQAEEIGTAYNVEARKITVSMVHIEGDATVTNEEDWITNEGQEKETAEHLRKRCINSRALIAERTIDRKLKSTVEEVPGVAVAYIDSQHPRGQGTVDIIVTGNSGTASPELIEDVEEAIEPLTGSYGDYLVKSSTQQKQDIEITVYIEKNVSTAGYQDTIESLIRNMMDIKTRDELNVLYRDSIIGTLLPNIPRYRKCLITQPAEDVHVPIGTVIVPGEIKITVLNVT
jgi:uncharacterized phage protein gp47/JayE